MADRDTLQPFETAKAERQIEEILSALEAARHVTESGTEFWFARTLMKLFAYPRWQKFRNVIERAFVSCSESGVDPSGHFLRGDGEAAWRPEEVFTQSGKNLLGGRPVEDVILTRRAAYLIAENADPAKLPVALAQRYFAEQTRRQELADKSLDALGEDQRRVVTRKKVSENNKSVAEVARDSGVTTQRDFAIFYSEGYKGMYDGLTLAEIKTAKGIPRRDPFLDCQGSTELAANLLRLSMTEDRLREGDIETKAEANSVHRGMGEGVRNLLVEKLGKTPLSLPAAQHIQYSRRRIASLDDDADSQAK